MRDQIMTMDASEFDLDKYLRASTRVDLSTVEWDRIREHPVTTDEARCLTYMMDIETHTVVFLRDLLATRASFDPEVDGVPLLLGVRGALARGGVQPLPG